MESLLLEVMYLPKKYSNSILSSALKKTKKRCSRKLHHLQLRCWMDLMFVSLRMGRLALVKHLRWKGLKVLEGLTTEL
uniref:Uncharacterized protein n=1 Tax=Arundo donax TaxID=35708 RepID=A0A0A9D9L8_ARUDO